MFALLRYYIESTGELFLEFGNKSSIGTTACASSSTGPDTLCYFLGSTCVVANAASGPGMLVPLAYAVLAARVFLAGNG